MFLHVFFFFPETSGKTLEEVEDIFTDPAGIKFIGTPAWKTKNEFRRGVQFERAELEDGKKLSFSAPSAQAVETVPTEPKA